MHAPLSHIKSTGRPAQQAAFDLLRKTKTRWVAKGFALQAAPAQKPDEARLDFCVITSKKTCAKATDRNRLRRRLKSVSLEILPVHASRAMDYMIVGRREGLDLPYDDLKRDMLWCLKKLNLQQQSNP